MTTYVVASASTRRDYSFTLPLACLFWRDVIGFTPVPYCIGDWDREPRTRIAFDALKELGFTPALVQKPLDWEESNLSQNIRQHACARIPDRDAWAMPSDADLIPLKRDWYQQHENTDHPLMAVSYFSNGDHFVSKQDVVAKMDAGNTSFQSLPTCHVAMRVRTWASLYPGPADPEAATLETLESWVRPKMQGKAPNMAAWEAWMSDQRIMTERLCRADWFPAHVKFVERVGPPYDRLDRGDWQEQYIGAAIDAHVMRPPDSLANWFKLSDLVKRFLPARASWADDYAKRHRESYEPY